jgi:hypothetical protein
MTTSRSRTSSAISEEEVCGGSEHDQENDDAASDGKHYPEVVITDDQIHE